MNEALVVLGSNIQATANINQALALLKNSFLVIRESSQLTTVAVGVCRGQADFVNAGCLIKTPLAKDEFKNCLDALEVKLGRNKKIASSEPREIDMDIVLWNKLVVDDDLYQRDFLQKIVLEIYPWFSL